MSLAADELVAFLDGGDTFDLIVGRQRLQRVVGAFIADGADDSSCDAAHDVGLVAKFADF